HVDYLESTDPRDRMEILDEADHYANLHNEAWDGLIDNYKELFKGRNVTPSRVRLAERRGGDYAQIPGFDELVQSIRDNDRYAALRAYAESLGGGDVSSGLFETMRDGLKALEAKRRTADDYLGGPIDAHRQF